MTDLLAPLDDSQMALVDMVWRQYTATGKFPNFGWLDYKLSRSGLDAAAVIGGLPTLRVPQIHGGTYAAVWVPTAPLNPDTPVHLTVAALHQLMMKHSDGLANEIVRGILAHLQDLDDARAVLADHPHDTPVVQASLRASLDLIGQLRRIEHVGPVLEREWIAAHAVPQGHPEVTDWISTPRLLRDLKFTTVNEYLTALMALAIPEQTVLPTYTEPLALARAVSHFDVTCELVLGASVVKRPPIDRTAKLALDVSSLEELYSGIGAIGEILQELQVDGGNLPPVKRLYAHLSAPARLPNISQPVVQGAVDVLDAVRVIRNAGLHPKQKPELIQAHAALGIPFPIRDPAAAWNTMRAQLVVAFDTLQGEIYANK